MAKDGIRGLLLSGGLRDSDETKIGGWLKGGEACEMIMLFSKGGGSLMGPIRPKESPATSRPNLFVLRPLHPLRLGFAEGSKSVSSSTSQICSSIFRSAMLIRFKPISQKIPTNMKVTDLQYGLVRGYTLSSTIVLTFAGYVLMACDLIKSQPQEVGTGPSRGDVSQGVLREPKKVTSLAP
ncbi:hypothetical protein Sjap_022235 [Stephania japonica]|uniref:Uncharacterized protein n=1 Tax=Stephania japonica TaxID=461633 RepID=A0AAP0EU83_9MAGN